MSRRFRSVSMLAALGGILLGGLALSPGASAGAIWGLEVDAREISRHPLHARMEMPVQPGKLILWYPKWIPGTHAPSGPVQNLAGLRLECRDGQRQDLVDEERGKEWAVYLFPHEFVHSWCGKYRQPTGMISADFHAPERTRLLWVYEGYEDGLLLWMEADAILRNLSEGRRSLDDFCKTFLGPRASPSQIVGYDIGELTKTLNELASDDWDKFFHDWVKVPQETLPLGVVGRLGYRLQYSSKPSEHPRKNGAARNIISALASIGLAFGEDGKVLSVIPRMAGDEAGLAPGMMIVGVNSRKFNEERLRDAIAETVSRRQLEFLILEGDVVSTIVLPDADGLKYLELVRDGHGPDILKRILEPGLNEP